MIYAFINSFHNKRHVHPGNQSNLPAPLKLMLKDGMEPELIYAVPVRDMVVISAIPVADVLPVQSLFSTNIAKKPSYVTSNANVVNLTSANIFTKPSLDPDSPS